MIDYKKKSLSILEGVDWEKQVNEFPLIKSVNFQHPMHDNPCREEDKCWVVIDAMGIRINLYKGDDCPDYSWFKVYALLSHRVPQPDENGLLPCPFCGGEAAMESNGNFVSDKWYAFVKCSECEACGPHFKTDKIEISESLAIPAWNRRANQGGQNG